MAVVKCEEQISKLLFLPEMQPPQGVVITRYEERKYKKPTFALSENCEKLMELYIEKFEKLSEKIIDNEKEIEEITKLIDASPLTEIEREVVFYRYCVGLKIREIAERLCYTERAVYKIIERVVQKIYG